MKPKIDGSVYMKVAGELIGGSVYMKVAGEFNGID